MFAESEDCGRGREEMLLSQCAARVVESLIYEDGGCFCDDVGIVKISMV